MPEDGFIWNSKVASRDEDTTSKLDLGTVETDLRKMSNAIYHEASLDPMTDARGEFAEPDNMSGDMQIMPGDDFWL